MSPLKPRDRSGVWTEEDKEFHALTIHKIYEGVRTENSDLVSEALVDLEKWAMKQALWRGLFWGLLIGIGLGTAFSRH
jgi:hypothetical protein